MKKLYLALCVLALSSSVRAAGDEVLRLYVAPQGKDTAGGRSSAQPFATLERARDEIRTLKTGAALPPKGVEVELAGGVYVRDRSFELTEAGEVVLRAVGRGGGRRPARAPKSRFAKLRGRATVKMRTEEILALTRGR